MILLQFTVTGEQVSNEETEEVIREAEPHRGLVRYRPDGGELFIHTRVNMALLRAAASLPLLRLKITPRANELTPRDALLTPKGSRRNYAFLEGLCEDLAAAGYPACYIAEQHGEGRRDFYFTTEDVAGFEQIARAAAEALAFPFALEEHSLADVAPLILPTEAIGDLGLEIAPHARMRPTRFEFWGAEPSLAKLRAELEKRGYRFLGFETFSSELRMLKSVPIDGEGFLAVLREIVPLARSLQCSYRGTETVEGHEQFLLARPLPERYSGAGRGGFFRRIFGGGS
ncbi:MAG: hypothetical protein E5X49_10920 [Mesorhizobium sp.]|uniref:hypothetical protein n=1 Tax=Mesorhizobium sp. TaxID=1871066 RepID=UPI000FE55A98|nr:hypothetical protein [Mesorhizobium sp.]RWA73342.1 MAG: hypothetical protein EOQ28_14410 [Mesorhizobium sp.]RWC01857.1 MAG: hypothetical protein EOQ57_12905 [Mesorhizobium sp.]TIQ43571.1 MAG: hypothetical protein E5X49_10920 [Mesorhizobium sp.]